MRRLSLSLPKRLVFAPRRALSTAGANFSERERGEEARYFRREEEAKRQAIRAQFEKAMQAPDNHEDKQQLIELLSATTQEKKAPTLLSKLGLDDWKMALPLAILAGVPALSNEFIILSAETQLVGVFIFTCATVYSQAGSSLASSLDERTAEVEAELKTVDTNILSEAHDTIDATKNILELEKAVDSVHKLVDDLAVVQADSLNNAASHQYRDAIAKKLEALQALDDQVTFNVRSRMVNQVTGNVRNIFANDKKAKDAALEQALAVLAGGKSAKYGSDVVGNAFKASVQSYRETYAKTAPEKDELLVQLQKDIAAITTAPVISAKGSNVYESHRVL